MLYLYIVENIGGIMMGIVLVVVLIIANFIYIHYYKKNLVLQKEKEIIDEAARNVLEAREKYRQELDEVELQYNARIEQINQETQDAQYQCDIVQKALDALRERREVLNEDIRREKKKIEEQTFFKVNLSPEALSDIQVLREIAPKLNRRIDIDKMIYDTYCVKPVLEMTRRVLNGEQPSGIYKITREKTGEIYIGKSTNVRDRWVQHAKSAYHCGTISHSRLHTIMEEDGIENFTFELLEKVSKDKLTEREKYWTEFYDTKKFGLNERVG